MTRTDERRHWKQINKQLVELKDALAPVVKDNITILHTQIYDDVCNILLAGSSCTECTTANVTPCYRTNGICHYDNGQCTYHDRNDPSRAYRSCPKGICDKVYKKLRKQHRNDKLTMRNTDVSKWSEDSWEMAKCFMPEGYANTTSAGNTDLSGLTAVFINCKYMQNVVKDDLSLPENIFCKLRDVRNKMVHSPNNRITGEQWMEYRSVIVTVYRDNKLKIVPSVSIMSPQGLWDDLTEIIVNTLKDESTWDSSVTHATSITYKRSKCEISDTDIKREAYNHFKGRLLQKQRDKFTPDSSYNLYVEVDNTLGCKQKAQKWAESREVEDRSSWTNEDKEMASYDLVLYVKLDNRNPRTDIFQLIQSQMIKDNPRLRKEVLLAMMGFAGKVLVLLDSSGLQEWSPPGIPSIGILDETELMNRKLKRLGIILK